MATSYNDVYDRAIFRFADYDFLKIDIQSREDILEKYLHSAIADVSVIVEAGTLEFSDDDREFVEDVDDEVQEILALGIDYYWLSAKVQNSELMRNSLSTKDFTYFSPANLMRELINLRNDVKKEYRAAITFYSYNHGDFASLGN